MGAKGRERLERQHRERKRHCKSRGPLLFSPLLSFHCSSSSPPPPLFLSASLNSPSLIQLRGKREPACSDRFTQHGPPSLAGSPLLRPPARLVSSVPPPPCHLLDPTRP